MALQSLLRDGQLPDAVKNVDAKQAALGVVAATVVYQCASWLIASVAEKNKMKRLGATSKPAVPSSTLPIIHNTLDFVKHTEHLHDWLMTLVEEYQGRTFVLRALGRPDVVVFSSQESIEDVMKKQFDSFPKGAFLADYFGDVFGEGIFVVNGVKWLHQRKTASNLFTARSLRESMTETIRKHTVHLRQILLDAGAQDKTVDLHDLFSRLSAESFAEIGFGINMGMLDNNEGDHPFQVAFDRSQHSMTLRRFKPSWFWLFQKRFKLGAEAQISEDAETIHTAVLDIIAESLKLRQSGATQEGPVNLVSLFLDSYEKSPDAKNGEFDPKYLVDVVVNFINAGRDTTAQALSWFFKNLTQHPEVTAKLRAELYEVLPGLMDGSIDTPTMEQVEQLTYLEAAIRESLRLYPALPYSTKVAANDVVMSDGTFIRKGQSTAIPAYAYNRMKYVWGPDAAEYNPERFIDPETGKIITYSPYKFFAFNAGPRICLGMNLAMLELKIVAASLLSRVDLEVLNPDKVTYKVSLTLPVRDGMPTRVSPYTHKTL
ncbi:hypothetical protein Poli38472_005326 [Pythium oligandrum]|uniref:Cytochrome P450 n=1 Tax=Pythium oligandrum TaxID=41045 RepID=A0A8K1CHR7_PYTOL|nr:hypothetical protein Poli38472_005326 [Pythium oligandrum]|eukprot:TMW62708.1 hypothetical protein Poli38472_005326 [Pythium oligandrum]